MKNAKSLSKRLVEKKLAACVNIIPKIQSIYMWNNKLCDEMELLLVIKSKKTEFKKLKNKIESLHPYDIPEIIAVDIKKGSKKYLDWLNNMF